GSDRHATSRCPVKIGGFCRGRGLAPRVTAFDARHAGHGGRGKLPLGLGRQAPSGPAAPGGGLMPVDVDHRFVIREDFFAIKMPPPPDAVCALPVQRRRRALTDAPCPTFITPPALF